MADISAIFGRMTATPTLYDSFIQGREARQRRTMNDQAIESNQQVLDNAPAQSLGERDVMYVNALSNTARLMSATPPELWGSLLQNRKQQFEQAGFPTDGIDSARQMYEQGDTEGLQGLIEQYSDLEVPGQKRVQSSTYTQLTDDQGHTVPAQAVTYSDGTSELVPLKAPEGYAIPLAETPQEKRMAEFLDFQRRQQTETNEAANRAFNNAIAEGNASDMATAKRGIISASNNLRKAKQLVTLLDEFETGGFGQRMQNTFQSFFGFRPANEEEADNLMRAQALALLANFTGAISEGERVFVLEMAPNFGLSSEGNRRLLNNFIEDAQIQIAAGDAAMKGRDAYDSYMKTLVKDAKVEVTEADVLEEFSEDQIAKAAQMNNMTHEEVIQQLMQDMAAERARSK